MPILHGHCQSEYTLIYFLSEFDIFLIYFEINFRFQGNKSTIIITVLIIISIMIYNTEYSCCFFFNSVTVCDYMNISFNCRLMGQSEQGFSANGNTNNPDVLSTFNSNTTRVIVMDNGLGFLTNTEEEQINFVVS